MDNRKQTTMLTIYTVTVPVKDQDQADRLKQICIDYGLPIWENKIAFKIFENDEKPILCFSECYFMVVDAYDLDDDDVVLTYPEITEQQFIELLKNTR